MTTQVLSRRTHSGAHAAPPRREAALALQVSTTVIAIAVAVLLVYLADQEARSSRGTTHYLVFWAGYLLGFGTLALAGFREWSARRRYRLPLVGLAIFTFLPKFLMSVNHPSYYDEWGHWRHVNDILSTGSLDPSDPFQPIIKYFPGLGVVTAGVHEVTRLNTWHSGQIVILAAHIAALLALFGIARALKLSDKGAFTAALIYAASPNYAYFDAQYAYESLALPLALVAIYLGLRAINATDRRAAWIAGASVFIAATAVTHHVSSIFLAAVMVLIAPTTLGRQSRKRTLTAFTLAAASVAVPLVWLVTFARPTIDYLKPRLSTIWDQCLQEVGLRSAPPTHAGVIGVATGPAGRTLFGGNGPPRFEEIAAVLAPLLIGILILIAAVRLVQARRATPLLPLLPFALLVVTYFAMLPLNFLASATEVVHRSWGFSYVGIAIVAGAAVSMAPSGKLWHRLDWLSRPMGLVTRVSVLVPILLIVVMGNAPAGTNAEYRFPGPYEFTSDSWGINSSSIALARWVNKNLPASAEIVTDRVTGEIITGYSTARVPNPDQGAVFGLYLNPENPSAALRAALRKGGFSYFILDTHIFNTIPSHSWFETYHGPGSVSVPALKAIRSGPFIRPISKMGSFIVYKVSP